VITGALLKEDVVNMLLDLRHYVATDISCYQTEDVKVALNDVLGQIDTKLKELTG
jgi:hypothetical protein